MLVLIFCSCLISPLGLQSPCRVLLLQCDLSCVGESPPVAQYNCQEYRECLSVRCEVCDWHSIRLSYCLRSAYQQRIAFIFIIFHHQLCILFSSYCWLLLVQGTLFLSCFTNANCASWLWSSTSTLTAEFDFSSRKLGFLVPSESTSEKPEFRIGSEFEDIRSIDLVSINETPTRALLIQVCSNKFSSSYVIAVVPTWSQR